MAEKQIVKREMQLPATIEELSQLTILLRGKVSTLKAEINAIDKLGIATDFRTQRSEDATFYSELLLDAETKVGELLSSHVKAGSHEQKIPDEITRHQSSAFQKMAGHKDIVEKVKAKAKKNDILPTRTEVLKMIGKLEGKPHVAYNSGDNEWYTPKEYIEAARKVMGTIDLDPASTLLANTIVKAEQIYTIDDDGLAQEWIGNIWLNPPYAGDLIQQFVGKLSEEIHLGNVESAIVLVNNATETKWFLMLVEIAPAICFPTGRVKYWGIDGSIGMPLQGQAIIYIGDKSEAFCDEFKQFGWIATL